jgi:hypothetical protein
MKVLAAATALVLGLGAGSVARAQSAPAGAQGGHIDAAPHGGTVIGIANHHVEFKADSTGTILVWLLDGKEKTVTPPAGGTVTLIGAGTDQVTLPLAVDAPAQRLTAKFDTGKFPTFQAVVSMTIEGKRQNLRFRYPSHH